MTVAELRKGRGRLRARVERKTLPPKPTREQVDLDKLERDLAEEFRVAFAELAK